MRRIGMLNPYPRPRERQGSGNRLPIRLGRQPRPCRHRSVRRRQINYLYYGSGHLHQISLDDEVFTDIERDRLHREIFRTQGKLASRYELDPLGWSTVYLRNGEVYIGKAKHNAQKRYGKTGCATDIYTGITAKEGAKKPDGTLMKDTDVAQGVEQIVYEVLLEMGKEGLITGKITNKNRPVNPAKESKKEEEQLV